MYATIRKKMYHLRFSISRRILFNGISIPYVLFNTKMVLNHLFQFNVIPGIPLFIVPRIRDPFLSHPGYPFFIVARITLFIITRISLFIMPFNCTQNTLFCHTQDNPFFIVPRISLFINPRIPLFIVPKITRKNRCEKLNRIIIIKDVA